MARTEEASFTTDNSQLLDKLDEQLRPQFERAKLIVSVDLEDGVKLRRWREDINCRDLSRSLGMIANAIREGSTYDIHVGFVHYNMVTRRGSFPSTPFDPYSFNRTPALTNTIEKYQFLLTDYLKNQGPRPIHEDIHVGSLAAPYNESLSWEEAEASLVFNTILDLVSSIQQKRLQRSEKPPQGIKALLERYYWLQEKRYLKGASECLKLLQEMPGTRTELVYLYFDLMTFE